MTDEVAMTDEAASPGEGRSGPSIQELLFPDTTCFGCGHANPSGYHLRSYRDDEGFSATFIPRPEHDNGFGFLNGGIITMALDCHTAAATMWEAHQRGWEADEGAPVPFITAGIDVRFLRPTPLGPPLVLRARPEEVTPARITVAAELGFDGKQRATAVATWMRFHPR